MVIVKIKAGLGNQMFQYACGRALAVRSGSELQLDVTDWTRRDEKYRQYLLPHFNIVEKHATDADILRLRDPHGIFSKIRRRIMVRLFKKGDVTICPRTVRKGADVYLDGYWQSESYFLDQAETIRKDFTPKTPLGGAARASLLAIQADPSAVSLHIRRGDNAHSPASMKAFGLISMDFYKQAIGRITEALEKKNGKPAALHLYVFSDEIDWCKENLRFDPPLDFPMTFVSRPEIADWEEIFLMSACRHHIIANSSFSWWGAWLDPRPDKIVVAPRRWALQNEHQFCKIAPPSWIRL